MYVFAVEVLQMYLDTAVDAVALTFASVETFVAWTEIAPQQVLSLQTYPCLLPGMHVEPISRSAPDTTVIAKIAETILIF